MVMMTKTQLERVREWGELKQERLLEIWTAFLSRRKERRKRKFAGRHLPSYKQLDAIRLGLSIAVVICFVIGPVQLLTGHIVWGEGEYIGPCPPGIECADNSGIPWWNGLWLVGDMFALMFGAYLAAVDMAIGKRFGKEKSLLYEIREL